MSTRCQIQVKFLDREILLYHHHDGYPEGVGADLIKRQQTLNSWNGSILVNNLIKDKTEEYEISYVIHTDLDYWYEINCNKRTIKCWKVKGYLLSDHAEVRKGEEIPLQYNQANQKHNI